MSKTLKITAVLIVIAAAVNIFLISNNNLKRSDILSSKTPNEKSADIPSNVSVVDGTQFIEITAKGGYSPEETIASAGVPTLLKVKTKGTFDCSSALSIPSLNYRKNLPPTGETIIEIPAQEAGSNLRGVCSMGMYGFSVRFE